MKRVFPANLSRFLAAWMMTGITILLLSGCSPDETIEQVVTIEPTPTPLPDPVWTFVPFERQARSIVDMVVDPDGVVWTVGKGGAARWDMETGGMQTFGHADGMPGYDAAEIMVDANGAVWINWAHPTFKGYGVSRFYQDTWEHFSTENGLAHNLVAKMSPGPDGKIWFATPSGVSVYDTGTWQTFTTGDGLPSDTVNFIYAAPDSSAWVHTYDGVGFYIDGAWGSYSGGINRANVNDIFQDKNGNIWFATSDYIFRYDGESYTQFNKNNEGLDGSKAFLSITQTDDGTVWSNGAQGLFAWRNNQWYPFIKDEGLPFFCAEGLFHDSRDTLWAISDKDGLFMIPTWSLRSNGIGAVSYTIVCKGDIGVELKKLMSVDELDDYACLDDEVYTGKAVELPDGSLVLASSKKLTILYPDGEFSELAFPEIEKTNTQLKQADPQDRRLGPDNDFEFSLRTLYQYVGDERIDVGQDNELLDGIDKVREGPDGRLWVASDYAISVWDGSQWEHWTIEENGENKRLYVGSLLFQDGDLLIADRTRGISRLVDSNLAQPVWESIPMPDWPRDNNAMGITSMVADPKGGFWAKGFYGMPAYYDGTQWHLIPQEDYRKIFISSMDFAPNGDLWLAYHDQTGMDWDKNEYDYVYYFKRFDGQEWHDIGNSGNLPPASTRSVIFQESGDVWVSFDEYGLVRYDMEGNFIEAVNSGNVFEDSDQVFSMYVDEMGALIAILGDGTARYGIPVD